MLWVLVTQTIIKVCPVVEGSSPSTIVIKWFRVQTPGSDSARRNFRPPQGPASAMSALRLDLIGCSTFFPSNGYFPPCLYRVFYFPPYWRDYKSPRYPQRSISLNQNSQTQEHILSLAPGPNVPRAPYPFPNNERPPFIRRARLPFCTHQDINITSVTRRPLSQKPLDSTSRLNTDLLGLPSRLRQHGEHETISQTLVDAVPSDKHMCASEPHTEFAYFATNTMNPNKNTVTTEAGINKAHIYNHSGKYSYKGTPATHTTQLPVKDEAGASLAHLNKHSKSWKQPSYNLSPPQLRTQANNQTRKTHIPIFILPDDQQSVHTQSRPAPHQQGTTQRNKDQAEAVQPSQKSKNYHRYTLS